MSVHGTSLQYHRGPESFSLRNNKKYSRLRIPLRCLTKTNAKPFARESISIWAAKDFQGQNITKIIFIL